jgi:hypothetical protein
MKKIAIASIITVFLALTCAFVAGTISAQGGWEKTITLPSGEKVLDMRGEWDALVEPLGGYKIYGETSNIVLITQEGNTFSGLKQTEGGMIRKGTKTWRGVLDKDGFKEAQFYARRYGRPTWIAVTWEIIENGNKIMFVDEGRVKWTLTRR